MHDISRSRGPAAVTSRTRPADSTPWRRSASMRWSGLATSGRSVVTSRLYQGWHVTGSQCRLRVNRVGFPMSDACLAATADVSGLCVLALRSWADLDIAAESRFYGF